MLKALRLLLATVICGFLLGVGTVSANQKVKGQQKMDNQIILSFDGKDYNVKTEDNATVKALTSRLPLTMKMKELNGNERFHYLSKPLLSKDTSVHTIKKGDIMLYDSDCIVVFYKSFHTSYRYTKIGHIQKFDSAAKKMAKGNVTITLKK